MKLAQRLLLTLLIMTGAPMASAATLLVLGDSLSAAYGIPQQQGWVALLQQRLPHHTVINASISGETSSGGASRIGPLLQQHRPQIVIFELGANDGLRGLPLAELKSNLERMIRAAKHSGARIMLVGMRLPPNYGPRYTRGFEALYTDLAREHDTALLPFLFAGLEDSPRHFQSDNLHPTAAAQPLLLENIWRALQPLLASP